MKNKSNIIFATFLAALILVAIGLGVGIYLKKHPKAPALNANAGQNQPANNSGAASGTDSNILHVPPPGASQDAIQKHFQLAASQAQKTPFVDITGCKASPVVFETKQMASFGVKNNDATDHVLGFDLKHTFTIPAKGQKAIVANFDHGPGLYGYGCDSQPGVVGFFLIDP
jgi:hypothetical protein